MVVEKPKAPASMASPRSALILRRLVGVAARSIDASPIT
jgi:hypothetical protein